MWRKTLDSWDHPDIHAWLLFGLAWPVMDFQIWPLLDVQKPLGNQCSHDGRSFVQIADDEIGILNRHQNYPKTH